MTFDMTQDHATSDNRLLVGLFPNGAVSTAIELHRRQWWWPKGCHFPPLSRLHLTLGYLDEHEERCEERLLEALSQVRMKAFGLMLDQSGTWSNGVSVIQPAPHGQLFELRERIWSALQQADLMDLAKTSGWKPHITIARASERAACPTMSPIPWAVSEIRVVRSHFTTPFRHEHLAAISARHGLRRLTASLH